MAGGGLSTYDPRTKGREDLAAELSVVQRKLKNPNTPGDVRKALQRDAYAMMEEHLVNAAKSEATTSGDTVLAEQAANHKPGKKLSPELSQAVEKEVFDITLRAIEMISTEDVTEKKKPGEDASIKTARALLMEIAPTYADAEKLFEDAYTAKNGMMAEKVGHKFVSKKNVVAARQRLQAMYEN